MTELMEKVFVEVAKLKQDDQNMIAARILEEIEDEQRSAEKFFSSQDTLARIVDEARKEIPEGKTYPLDDIL